MVMAGINVAESAPVSCTSTAPEVEVNGKKPLVGGTSTIPAKVADESEEAVNVNEGAAVSAILVPSAFLAVMTVLGDSVALAVARYPEVPGAVATTVGFGPVVAVPSGLTVAAKDVAVERVIAGASSPPPHPPAIIKTPSKAASFNIFNNLIILNTPFS